MLKKVIEQFKEKPLIEGRGIKVRRLTEAQLAHYDRRATVASFDDYHEIDAYAVDLSQEFGRRVRSVELGFVEGMPGHEGYFGLFYVGRKPAKRVILSLVRKVLRNHSAIGTEGFDIEVAAKCVAGGGSFYRERGNSWDHVIEDKWVCEK